MGLKQLLLPGVLLLFAIQISFAQSTYWQQAVEYNMNIDFDVKSHRFTGDQSIRYTNNSPDTLHRVFYHLYFNAFQPGSMMDTRSLTIRDADPRVADRIKNLKPNEIGYQKIDALTQDGEATTYEIVGTILEVELAEPILPGTTTELNMKFNAPVPVH
ncbi:MAG: M1 family peptidase, partial [Bacteroidota bacterium]